MRSRPWLTALLWVVGAIFVALGYRAWGWGGVALAVGVAVFWLLLHFTRTMQVLNRAAQRPIGHVDSAVMLNSRLRPGLRLLHVIALTRSLGALQSPKDQQPEHYRWSDAGDSWVDCEFAGGKLVRFALHRPVQSESTPSINL